MKTGRICTFLLFGIALALGLAACLPVPPSPTPVPTQVPTKTPTIVPDLPPVDVTPVSPLGVAPDALRGLGVEVRHAQTGPAADLFDRLVEEFNETNPWGITVWASAYRGYPELFDLVSASLGTFEQPGVVLTLPEHIFAWDTQGFIVDLNTYIQDPLWGFSEEEIADIPAAFWAQDQKDNRQLALPAQRSTRLLFYNTSWAQELGFNNPPATADDFRAQACAANQAFRRDADLQNDGFGGWVVDSDPQTALSWLLAFGGGAISRGEREYTFTTPLNQQSLEFVKELYDRSCAWLTLSGTSPNDVFAARKALFISGTLSDIQVQNRLMESAGNTDKWTVIPFPGSDRTGMVIYGPSFALIESGTLEHVAAWLFVRWMLEPERQAEWVEATGLYPMRVTALESLSGYRTSRPQWEAAVGLIPQGQTIPGLASWRVVKFALGDAFGSIFRLNLPLNQIPAVLVELDATAQELNR